MTSTATRRASLALLCAILWALGCTPAATTDAGTDTPDAPACLPTTELDLLFVIDDSGSMSTEQALLLTEIPEVLAALAPVASIHVGVVSTDLGAGNRIPEGTTVPSCDSGFAGDGILRNTSASERPECRPTYPSRVFELASGAPSADLAVDLTCVAELGTNGCAFGQQLEASLKALSPVTSNVTVSATYVPPTFAEDGTSHGDTDNAGFLRPDSVLAVVLFTDSDDCSLHRYDMLYGEAYGGLNFRCIRYPDELHPVSRYVDGLMQLRENPRRLVLLPIVGVPPDLIDAPYDDMLLDARMQYYDPFTADVSRTCDGTSGVAYPPRRIVEVARGLRERGANTAVASICEPEGTAWRTALIEQVSAALSCADL